MSARASRVRSSAVASPRKHRALFLTCHLPFPPISGGRRREYELIRRLAPRWDISLCAVTKTLAMDREHVQEAQEWCSEVMLYPAADVEGARGEAPQLARHACPAATDALRELSRSVCPYDLVHVEGFYLMQHLPPSCRIPVLLCEQNIEHLLWRQRAALAANDDHQEQLRRHARTTRQAEHAAWLRADLCATVTDSDRQVMQAELPALEITVIPDGADHGSSVTVRGDPVSRRATHERPNIVLVGNFGYQPNVDAATHMCKELLPRIRSAVPDAQLLLVGSSPPPELRRIAAAAGNVIVTGQVDEVESYLVDATVVALPLRIGGGVKVKVLDALRCGSAIVTTPIGAQGLGQQALAAMRVVEDDAGFASAVVDLIESPTKRNRLRHAAARAARQLPTWEHAGQALLRAYEGLLEPSTRVAA